MSYGEATNKLVTINPEWTQLPATDQQQHIMEIIAWPTFGDIPEYSYCFQVRGGTLYSHTLDWVKWNFKELAGKLYRQEGLKCA